MPRDVAEMLTFIPAPRLVPEGYAEAHKGYAEQADAFKARAERAEQRVADLEEVIREVSESIARLRIREASALLTAALTCPLCGARSESECLGRETRP